MPEPLKKPPFKKPGARRPSPIKRGKFAKPLPKKPQPRPKPTIKALRALKRLVKEKRIPQSWLEAVGNPTLPK